MFFFSLVNYLHVQNIITMLTLTRSSIPNTQIEPRCEFKILNEICFKKNSFLEKRNTTETCLGLLLC